MTSLDTARADVAAKGYARPGALVTTAWLAEHLDDPTLRIVEGNEDVLLYDIGHIRNAQKIDWHLDLNDRITRDYGSRRARPLVTTVPGFAPTGYVARERNDTVVRAFRDDVFEHALYETEQGPASSDDVITYCRIGDALVAHVVRADVPAWLPHGAELRRKLDGGEQQRPPPDRTLGRDAISNAARRARRSDGRAVMSRLVVVRVPGSHCHDCPRRR